MPISLRELKQRRADIDPYFVLAQYGKLPEYKQELVGQLSVEFNLYTSDGETTAKLLRLRDEDRIAEMFEMNVAEFLKLVTAWDVEGDDGQTIPLTEEGIAQVPQELINDISQAIALYKHPPDEEARKNSSGGSSAPRPLRRTGYR